MNIADIAEIDWQAALDERVYSGKERGIQFAVYQDGELVVNVAAGAMSPGGSPVSVDTLFPVFSVSKGIAATVIHRLVARGILSCDLRLAAAWPEFGAHGKGDITLRHVLDHTAGLAHMPAGLATADLADWEKMTAAIADLTPTTKPGEKMEYHAMTFGWLIGELARRVDGRDFPRMLAEEISGPLVSDGIYIGLPEAMNFRVAELEESRPSPDIVSPPIPAYACPLAALLNRLDIRRGCIAASNGIMSAEAIARHYAALLPGGVDGVELLSPEHVRELSGAAKTVGGSSWQYGYQFPARKDHPATLGHNGYGGSTGFADLEKRFAVGLTRNCFDHAEPADLIGALYTGRLG